MVSELIVIIDTGPREVDEAWSALARNPGSQLFRLTDMVLIRRDKGGKVSFEIRSQESDRLIEHHKRLAGDFAEAIFGQSQQDGHWCLTEAGIDPIFLQDITKAFQPNRSAYLFYIPAESRIDTTRYIESLQPLQGDLYHTTFPAQVEEFLSKSADSTTGGKLDQLHSTKKRELRCQENTD
jgi:uncharacterized membrane protein